MAHYGQTWRHPQNRKYIAYCIVVRYRESPTEAGTPFYQTSQTTQLEIADSLAILPTTVIDNDKWFFMRHTVWRSQRSVNISRRVILSQCKDRHDAIVCDSLRWNEIDTAAWLWSPYGIGQAIIFLPCGFFLSFFFSSPSLSGRRLDVNHFTHGVALVRI